MPCGLRQWDRQPYLHTASADGQPALTPKTHRLLRNFIFNANFEGHTSSGYAVDYDDGSSDYDADGNVAVLLQGAAFKIRDGVRRTITRNLAVGGGLANPQIAGFDSNVVADNVAVDPTGTFYACVGNAWKGGMVARNNSFYTPGAPPVASAELGTLSAAGRCRIDAAVHVWPSKRHSTMPRQ